MLPGGAMSSKRPPFVFVHSPLVGPFTWSLVAGELQRRGAEVLTPALRDPAAPSAPFWQQHAESVAAALRALSSERAPILVGHSGAGALLPAIRAASGRPGAGYIFVDAGIPQDGESRIGAPGSAFAGELRALYAAGGRFPNWSDAGLAAIVPNAAIRRRLLDDLRPQPLAFWEEPIPVFSGWPDAPCAYLHLSPAYDEPAAQARAAGWPVRSMPAGHFHMLVDPAAVADTLLDLAEVTITGSCGAPHFRDAR